MKTLRRLQLRQGQELSQSEQQHVMAGENFFLEKIVGRCTCVEVGDRHGETWHGYTLSTSYADFAIGLTSLIGGAASIYITGGLAAYLGGGSAILSGGYQMYSSVNKRTNVTKDVIQELVNKSPWTHNALK